MLIQALKSPEVYLGAALVIFLVLLLVSMVLSAKPDAKMDCLCDLMKDFPKEGEDASGRQRPEIEAGLEEEPAHPMPRNIDF